LMLYPSTPVCTVMPDGDRAATEGAH
jgi:hypothetical protein